MTALTLASAGLCAYFFRSRRSMLMKGPPGSESIEAVPSRTKRPELVMGREVPGREPAKALSTLPVPGREPVPGRA